MSEKRILRVGLIQQANTADHSDNKRRLKEAIRSAATQGAELVVLQDHGGIVVQACGTTLKERED